MQRNELIVSIRKQLLMTQKGFAEFCGVSPSTISNIELGYPVGIKAQIKILESMLRVLKGEHIEKKIKV